jgi:Cu(I)/Ag(I) efflux system membrane protein CusA/SilA
MTVSTMLIGLVPLLWAQSSGADVMKRIAAPMVGGLVTSAFLTLEIIPVVVTYWRLEQLLWEKLAQQDPAALAVLKFWRALMASGAALAVATLVSRLYWDHLGVLLPVGVGLGMAAFATGLVVYLLRRPAARRLVWAEASEAP